MQVLHVAAECQPFATTGGLGDVLGALPGALCAAGCDARIALPAYGWLADDLRRGREQLRFDCRGQPVRVVEAPRRAAGAIVYLFDMPGLFDRGGDPYRDADGRLFEDLEWRFARFCEAVARALVERALCPAAWVHAHDWHAALLPHWLRRLGFAGRSLLTVHNLAFQGWRADRQAFVGLEDDVLADAAHADGGWSMLKAGLLGADRVSTVSPGYAREIQTEAFGCGLQLAVRARAADGELHGIVNGLNAADWDPRRDPALPRPYGPDDVAAGKAENALALATELGLAVDASPLVAFVGRLTAQKGADLIAAAGSALLHRRARYVLLGIGDADIEQALTDLDAGSDRRLRFCRRFDAGLARRLYAAADLLLVPSRFEPCGLVQMHAQRYGALPVATRVGGLADTIVDAAEPAGSGVLFDADGRPGTLLAAIDRGLRLVADPTELARLRRAGMRRSFDWTRVVPRYLELYGVRSPAGTLTPPAGMAGIAREVRGPAGRPPAAAAENPS